MPAGFFCGTTGRLPNSPRRLVAFSWPVRARRPRRPSDRSAPPQITWRILSSAFPGPSVAGPDTRSSRSDYRSDPGGTPWPAWHWATRDLRWRCAADCSDLNGARLLAEIGNDRNRFASDRALEVCAGSAPVTRASGKTVPIAHRRIKDRMAAAGWVWAFTARRPRRGRRRLERVPHDPPRPTPNLAEAQRPHDWHRADYRQPHRSNRNRRSD